MTQNIAKRITRLTAAGVLLCFLLTQQTQLGLAAATAPVSSNERIAPKPFPEKIESIHLPKEMGRVENSFKGSGPETVVVIQDAHAIPDAQKSIQKIIGFFQKQYGVQTVGLEGASEQLDPQMFKSFPDKNRLREVLSDYLSRGELTAGNGMAIFSDRSSVYRGVENWDLYVKGVSLYLAAMERESELSSKLKVQSSKLEGKKKEVYSKELLELDGKLEKFFRGELDLVSAAKALGEVEKGIRIETGIGRVGESAKFEMRNPQQTQNSNDESPNVSSFDNRNSDLQTAGSPRPRVSESSRLNSFSSVAAFLEEIKNGEADHSSLDQEVRRIAGEIKKSIVNGPSTMVNGLWTDFNLKSQQFQTSQITPQAFALFLKEFAAKNRLKIEFSSALSGGVEQQKTLRDLEGTTFLKEFEAYAKAVKESLMTSDEQKNLDAESREILLLEKLVKLELSREEWNEVKETRDKKQETGEVENFLVSRPVSLAPFYNFYENAEKRDEALLENLLKGLGSRKGEVRAEKGEGVVKGNGVSGDGRSGVQDILFPRHTNTPVPVHPGAFSTQSAILVAGGFHAQGITQKLREKNISYVLVMPEIKNIPKETDSAGSPRTIYREHMKGNVSWEKYLHPRNGWVEHYPAFVRGVRDQLLRLQSHKVTESQGEKQDENPGDFVTGDLVTLKSWRDQIIRDLADAGKVEQSGQYTKFLDELIINQKGSISSIAEGLLKIRNFLDGLNQLRSQGKMQPENVLALFPSSAAASTPIASAASPNLLTPLAAVVPQRSEMRDDGTSSKEKPVIKVGKKKAPKKTSWVLELVKIVAGGAGGLGIGAVILFIFGLGPFAKPSVQPPAKAPPAQVAGVTPKKIVLEDLPSPKQNLVEGSAPAVPEEKKSPPVQFPSPLNNQAPAANILTQVHWGAYSGSDAFSFPLDEKGVLNLSELNPPAQGWKMGWLAEPLDIFEYSTAVIEYENPGNEFVVFYLELKGDKGPEKEGHYFVTENGKVAITIPPGTDKLSISLAPFLNFNRPEIERAYPANLLGISREGDLKYPKVLIKSIHFTVPQGGKRSEARGENEPDEEVRTVEVKLANYAFILEFKGNQIRSKWINEAGGLELKNDDKSWIILQGNQFIGVGRVKIEGASYSVLVPESYGAVSRQHLKIKYDEDQNRWSLTNLSSKHSVRITLWGESREIKPQGNLLITANDLNPPEVLAAEKIITDQFDEIVEAFGTRVNIPKTNLESRMGKVVRGMLNRLNPSRSEKAEPLFPELETVLRSVLVQVNIPTVKISKKAYQAALTKLDVFLSGILRGGYDEQLILRRLANKRGFGKLIREYLGDAQIGPENLPEAQLEIFRRELQLILFRATEVGGQRELQVQVNEVLVKVNAQLAVLKKKQVDENIARYWAEVVKLEKWRIEKKYSIKEFSEAAWDLNRIIPLDENEAVLEPGFVQNAKVWELKNADTSALKVFFENTPKNKSQIPEFAARRSAVLDFYHGARIISDRIRKVLTDLEIRQILADQLFFDAVEDRPRTLASVEKLNHWISQYKEEFPVKIFDESSQLSGAPFIRILRDLLPPTPAAGRPLSVGDEIEENSAGVNRAIINQDGSTFTVRINNWRSGNVEVKDVPRTEMEDLRSRAGLRLIRLEDRKDLSRSEAREVNKVSTDEYRLEGTTIRMQDYFNPEDVIGETVLLADNTGTMVVNYGDVLSLEHARAVKEMLSRGGAVIINSGDPLTALKNATYEALLKDLTAAEKQRFVIVADGGTTKLWFDQAGLEHIERMEEFPLAERGKFAGALAAAFYDQLKQRQGGLKDLLQGVSDEEIDAVKSAGMQRLQTIIAAENWGKVSPGEGKYIFELLPESWKEKWGDVFIYDTGAKVTVDTVKLRRDKIVPLEFTDGILQAIRPVTGENREGLYAVSGPGFVDVVKLSKVEGVTQIFNEKILPQLDAAKKTIFLVVGDSDNDLPTFGFKIPEAIQGAVLPVFLSHNEQYAASFSEQPFFVGRQNLEGSLDWIQAMNAVKGKTVREIDESGILNDFKIYRWVRNEQTDKIPSEAEARSELRETVGALLGRETPKLENAAAVVRIDREMGAEEFNRIFIEAALEVLGEDPFAQGLGDFVSKQENAFTGLMTRLGIEKFQLGFDASGAASDGELKDYIKMMIQNKAYLERVLISSGASRAEGVDELAKNGVLTQFQRTVEAMVRSAQAAGDPVLAILFPHLDPQTELQKAAAPVGAEGVGDLTEVSVDAAERTLLFQAALLRAAYLKKAATLKESERLEPFETLLKQLSPALEMKESSNSVTVNRSALKGILAAITQSLAAGKSA